MTGISGGFLCFPAHELMRLYLFYSFLKKEKNNGLPMMQSDKKCGMLSDVAETITEWKT